MIGCDELSTSAYSTSLGKLWSAGGRRGRHPRNVRRAASRCAVVSTGDSESPCGMPTAVFNGTDSASSIMTVIFIPDSRRRMIRTLCGPRNEWKTSRRSFRRTVSNSLDMSVPRISITYLYHWYLAMIHRYPSVTSAVDRLCRYLLWDGERKSSTLSEIRCNVHRVNVLRRVVSSTVGLRLFSDAEERCEIKLSSYTTKFLFINILDAFEQLLWHLFSHAKRDTQ